MQPAVDGAYLTHDSCWFFHTYLLISVYVEFIHSSWSLSLFSGFYTVSFRNCLNQKPSICFHSSVTSTKRRRLARLVFTFASNTQACQHSLKNTNKPSMKTETKTLINNTKRTLTESVIMKRKTCSEAKSCSYPSVGFLSGSRKDSYKLSP